MDIKYRNPITGEFDKIVLDNMIKIKTNPDEIIPGDTLTVFDISNRELPTIYKPIKLPPFIKDSRCYVFYVKNVDGSCDYWMIKSDATGSTGGYFYFKEVSAKELSIDYNYGRNRNATGEYFSYNKNTNQWDSLGSWTWSDFARQKLLLSNNYDSYGLLYISNIDYLEVIYNDASTASKNLIIFDPINQYNEDGDCTEVVVYDTSLHVNDPELGLIKFTNAYTDEDKDKVRSLPELVQQITESNKSYTDNQIEGLESTIPTKTSELENDSNFATKEFVEQEIANFDFIKIVTELPATGLINRTYFVPKIDTETNDLYDEYMWVNDKWELIGTKQIKIDLTNYATKDDIPEPIDVQIDGQSIVENGIANIPIANVEKAGLISYSSTYGLGRIGTNLVPLDWSNFVDKRNVAFMSYSKLDYAVKQAMCDGKGASWTEEEQAAARARMGVDTEYEDLNNKITDTTATLSQGITDSENRSKEYIDTKVGELRDTVNSNKSDTDSRLTELEQTPNVIIHGNPTVKSGQVSDFSDINYLQFPRLVTIGSQPFNIDFSIVTGNDITTQQNIIDSNFGLAFAIIDSHFKIALSSEGNGSWDIGEAASINTLTINTPYDIRISWDGNEYDVLVKTEDTYQSVLSSPIVSDKSLYLTPIYIGKSVLANNHFFKGILNLSECSLTLDSKVVWTGMSEGNLLPTLANLSDEGEKVIKDIAGGSGGAKQIQIGGEEPTDSNIILWFDENDSGYIIQYPDGDNIKYGTEVINNE